VNGTIEVAVATPADIDALVELESALFRDGAGRHEPYRRTARFPKACKSDIAP